MTVCATMVAGKQPCRSKANTCHTMKVEGETEIWLTVLFLTPTKNTAERNGSNEPFTFFFFYYDHTVCTPYLKMKMKSISNMQKVATLSMVFIRTTSCLLRAGMNLTSFSTLSSLKVLKTDKPPSDWPIISHTLRGEAQNAAKCPF